MYVDNFVFFSEDPAVETLFECLLQEQIKVDFMGLVEWFLGVCVDLVSGGLRSFAIGLAQRCRLAPPPEHLIYYIKGST